jgi:hypothetical protein
MTQRTGILTRLWWRQGDSKRGNRVREWGELFSVGSMGVGNSVCVCVCVYGAWCVSSWCVSVYSQEGEITKVTPQPNRLLLRDVTCQQILRFHQNDSFG